MFNLPKIIKHQGRQYISNISKVELPKEHIGMPIISNTLCKEKCELCKEVCPVAAIATMPVSIDMGKCVFCKECELVCPVKKITFTPEYKIASNNPDLLIVHEATGKMISFDAAKIRKEIKDCFGKSLKLRLVSCGSCNGCELELNACGNVNFDMGRFGIEFLASPRHCDGVVLTGPVVENSTEALRITIEAVPHPKIIILAGACAVSGGVFADSKAVDRGILKTYHPDLLIPGCPPHPLTVINGILDLIK